MEYCSAIKKNEILPFVTWMDLETMLNEIYVRQTRQTPYDFTHMCNLKNKANEQIKWNRNKLVNIEKKLMAAKGEGGEKM